jgi:hypothetical protein
MTVESRATMNDLAQRILAFTDGHDGVGELEDTAAELAARVLTATPQHENSAWRFPEITAYHGVDGAIVVEIDTHDLTDQQADTDRVPYMRLCVNDGEVWEHSPPQALPGSAEARDLDIPDAGAPIGRLAIVDGPLPVDGDARLRAALQHARAQSAASGDKLP